MWWILNMVLKHHMGTGVLFLSATTLQTEWISKDKFRPIDPL